MHGFESPTGHVSGALLVRTYFLLSTYEKRHPDAAQWVLESVLHPDPLPGLDAELCCAGSGEKGREHTAERRQRPMGWERLAHLTEPGVG
jgi:hypothetical protein